VLGGPASDVRPLVLITNPLMMKSERKTLLAFNPNS